MVTLVQPADQAPALVLDLPGPRATEVVPPTTYQIPESVAGGHVEGERHHVGQQKQGPNPDPDPSVKLEGKQELEPVGQHEQDGGVQEVTVEVVEDEGKAVLTSVPPLEQGHPGTVEFWTASVDVHTIHCTSRGVGEERAVVDLACVVTGGPKTERGPNQEEGWGHTTRPVQGVGETLGEFRSEHGRDVVTKLVALSPEEQGPTNVQAEQDQHPRHYGRGEPPAVSPVCQKAAFG